MRSIMRKLLVLPRIGEVEKRQRATVGDSKEQVAIIQLVFAEDLVAFAPRRHHRPTHDVFVEFSRLLQIATDIGRVMQSHGNRVRRLMLATVGWCTAHSDYPRTSF